MEEYIEKLKFLFSENLLLAALDLVDRESGKAPRTDSNLFADIPSSDQVRYTMEALNIPCSRVHNDIHRLPW